MVAGKIGPVAQKQVIRFIEGQSRRAVRIEHDAAHDMKGAWEQRRKALANGSIRLYAFNSIVQQNDLSRLFFPIDAYDVCFVAYRRHLLQLID